MAGECRYETGDFDFGGLPPDGVYSNTGPCQVDASSPAGCRVLGKPCYDCTAANTDHLRFVRCGEQRGLVVGDYNRQILTRGARSLLKTTMFDPRTNRKVFLEHESDVGRVTFGCK